MPDRNVIETAILEEIRLRPGVWYHTREIARRMRDVLDVSMRELLETLLVLQQAGKVEVRAVPAGDEYRLPPPPEVE